MKRIALSCLTLSMIFVLSACCCESFEEGWNQGKTQVFSDMELKLRGCEEGPERDRVQALLDKGQDPANSDRISIVGAGEFQADFNIAVQDGKVSSKEAKQLESKFKEKVFKK